MEREASLRRQAARNHELELANLKQENEQWRLELARARQRGAEQDLEAAELRDRVEELERERDQGTLEATASARSHDAAMRLAKETLERSRLGEKAAQDRARKLQAERDELYRQVGGGGGGGGGGGMGGMGG